MESNLENFDMLDITNTCELLLQRMQELNRDGTKSRSRNLSIAISTMETVIDKLHRTLNGE